MPISTHSHSGQFCRHGHGTLEQTVERAIALGFTSYALTEHVPRNALEHLYPEEEGMTVDDLERQFDAFLEEARRLQSKHQGRLLLPVGCETEWINAEYAQYMREVIDRAETTATPPTNSLTERPHGNLLVVGSVHHVAGFPIDFSADHWATALAHFGGVASDFYAAFFDAQHELLVHLRPHVVGHFDLVGIFAASPKVHVKTLRHPTVWAKVDRNVRLAISQGAVFEINARAWKKGVPGYPHSLIAQHIVSLGGRFTLSDDAHGPKDVALHYDDVLLAYLKCNAIQTLFYFTNDLTLESMDVNSMESNTFFEQNSKPLEHE